MVNETIDKYIVEAHKPKFEIGDKVKVKDLKNSEGVITHVRPFDRILNQYKYKVKDKQTGNVKTWNENSLEKIR